jgi:hypothetical protein
MIDDFGLMIEQRFILVHAAFIILKLHSSIEPSSLITAYRGLKNQSYFLPIRNSDLGILASFCCISLAEKEKEEHQAERMVSSIKLNALLRLHPYPINVVVYHDPSG